MRPALLDCAPERFAGREQMLLPEELVERCRPHAVRERLSRRGSACILRISREKLAYIVDSTAAPVACIGLVTTWIGYEVGLLGQALEQSHGLNMDAYLVLLASIPYSFYPLLAIVFVFMVAASGRDFGPMKKSEQQARAVGVTAGGHLDSAMASDCEPVDPVPGKPQRAMNAAIPIAVLVFGVVAGLYVTGAAAVTVENPGLKDIVGAANSYKALLWASLLSMATATLLSIAQRILSLEEVVNAFGFRQRGAA